MLDTVSGVVTPLDRGNGLYYGIARYGDKIYVAARNRLVSSDLAQEEERGEILVFDRTLQRCGTLRAPFPLRDLHEIAWHDGKLWATCSFDNMVALFDGERWDQWFPLGPPPDGASDVNHFNSFLFEQGTVWVLAHNRGASELLAFSLDTRTLKERIPLGNCGHNLWRENGQLFTCSSADGKLLGNQGFVLETGGFPRGVAFDGHTRCVGISSLAERHARDLSTGKLMVFRQDWTLQNQIDLPGEGLILDLLPLPDGFRHDGGAKSKASPWSALRRLFARQGKLPQRAA